MRRVKIKFLLKFDPKYHEMSFLFDKRKYKLIAGLFVVFLFCFLFWGE